MSHTPFLVRDVTGPYHPRKYSSKNSLTLRGKNKEMIQSLGRKHSPGDTESMAVATMNGRSERRR